MHHFDQQRILVAVTGGIAAYKACDFIRNLQRHGAQTQVIMTPDAEAFISPLTLASLSKNPVLTNPMETNAQGTPTHIALAQECDAMVILPCSANTLAKLAHGFSDNMVTTTALTFTHKLVVVAPAMNPRMWHNPMVQRNVLTLAQMPHVTIVPPDTGEMACGEMGEGKLADITRIEQWVYKATHPDKKHFKGKTVVVTAGGTREPLDSVRYLSNKSTGKMGIAIADELFAMGAHVVLVHTVKDLDKPYDTVFVQTVEQMAIETEQAFAYADGLIMAAAVSDFCMAAPVEGKVKKTASLTLELVQTPDIIKTLAAGKQPHQFVVGFAAEATTPLAYAAEKLISKQLDMIVVNDISRSDIGFESDHNEVSLLLPGKDPIALPKASKQRIARDLLRTLGEHAMMSEADMMATVSQNDLYKDDRTKGDAYAYDD